MNASSDVKKPADVLVIDDDEIMRDLVADWLEAAGYRVRKAIDGKAGLAAVKRAEPALVITDMCMPGTRGGTVIRRLSEEHPAVPIIAISGHYALSGCTADDARALGAGRVLTKPMTRSEIMRAVLELVGPPAPNAHDVHG